MKAVSDLKVVNAMPGSLALNFEAPERISGCQTFSGNMDD